MAKGDHQRMQNQTDYQGGLAQNHLNNLRTNLTRQNQGLENRFNVAADRGLNDYNSLMGSGTSILGTMMNGPMRNFGAYGGYQDFANTGGFSDQNKSDFRARAVAPMRAVYSNANREVDRAKSLQGGYSPNYTAAKAKMSRDLSYGLGDMSTNVEASLADAIRSGKLAGLGGMTNIDSALLNAENQRLGMGSDMFRNMVGLYGQAPGMAQMFGNQMLNSSGQQLNTEQLQSEIMRLILGAQNNVSNTTGNFQSAMGNVGSLANVIGDFGSLMTGDFKNVGAGGK
jgi:hypothetical protein